MSDIHDLEREIAGAKELVERRQTALKLAANPEFKKLFLEDYFVTEAARLVQLSADPVLNPEQRADALAMAQATGHCKRYLSMMVQMGAHAENGIGDMEEALEEARREEKAD